MSPQRSNMAATFSFLFVLATGFQRISTLLLCLLWLVQVDAQSQRDDVQTLLRFRKVMEPDSYTLTLGYWDTWKDTPTAPCDWWGVICTKNSTVAQISLSGWDLTQVPVLRMLSNLTDLRQLDLSFNNFQPADDVQIPDDIGSLVGLTHLILSWNTFSGSIPASISACRNLRYINIEQNSLAGEIPDLSGLMDLQYLYLASNQFSGVFPTWLGKLKSLLVISLRDNQFNGTIPSLSNLTNLVQVMLDDNNFTAFEEPIFPGAQSLEHLTVQRNQLQGPIPLSITKLRSLRILDLTANQLTGEIPSEFSLNMSEPVGLGFALNQLTGSIPENLLQPTKRATNLPSLNFSHNFLTGPIPLDGNKKYNYHVIDFSNNQLNGTIPSICKDGNSTYVNFFHVENNNLSGDIVDFLADCFDDISHLHLANNSFSGDLSRMVNLDPTFDSASPNLKPGSRDFSNNNFRMSTTEANPDPLRAMLEYFVLNTTISEFQMQGNNFSGVPLPAYFSVSTNSLQILHLSNSHLIGEISGRAFNSTWFSALQYLNFSNNDIEGPVPEAILLLPDVEVLDLTYNRLSGPLPTNVPDNLNTPAFFLGNQLCGSPLAPCSEKTALRWWILFIAIGGSAIIAIGSCVVLTWRWRKYHKLHQQDADLIKTLLEKESASLMSLRELRRATNNFAESEQIGQGGFGTVYTGKLNDGTKVAIKRSKCEGSEKDKDRFLNEVRILAQISHRHLVKLLGCCMENRIALLVFEFVPNGTLQEHLRGELHNGVGLSWAQRIRIAVQTADALNYLHSATTFPIYHRDVKSANILLDNDLNAKVADFGISKLAPMEATHVSTIAVQGTLGYIDPEYYTSYQLNDKSDVYSFGVVLLELISAKPAIDFLRGGEKTGLVSFAKSQIEDGDLEELIDEALLDTYDDLTGGGRESIVSVARLAMKCLLLKSKARPGMHQVRKELQDIGLKLQGQGTPKDFGGFIYNDVDKQDSLHDNVVQDSLKDTIVLLSDSFSWSNSSSFGRSNAAAGIQMLPSSHLTGVNSNSA